MKTIRDVIFKVVVLLILWFGISLLLVWDAIFNDRNILLVILECCEGIGFILGIFFLSFVWFGGLICVPFLLISIIREYIKNPDSCWSAKDSSSKTED